MFQINSCRIQRFFIPNARAVWRESKSYLRKKTKKQKLRRNKKQAQNALGGGGVTVGPRREHSRVSAGGVKHCPALLLLGDACWTAEDRGGDIFEVRTAAPALPQYGRLARSFTLSAVRLIGAAAFCERNTGCYCPRRQP